MKLTSMNSLLPNSMHAVLCSRTRLRPDEAGAPLLAGKTSVNGLGPLLRSFSRVLVRMITMASLGNAQCLMLSLLWRRRTQVRISLRVQPVILGYWLALIDCLCPANRYALWLLYGSPGARVETAAGCFERPFVAKII